MIENFFIEFFITIRSNLHIFFDDLRELKYFDHCLISIFEKILKKIMKIDINQITFNINLELYETFLKLDNQNEINNHYYYNCSNSDDLNFLLLNKDQFLRDFFRNYKNENLIINHEKYFNQNNENNYNTSNFSIIDDQNLHSSDLSIY